MTFVEQIQQHWVELAGVGATVFLIYKSKILDSDTRVITMQKERINLLEQDKKDAVERFDSILRDQTAKADQRVKELGEKISDLALKTEKQAADISHMQGSIEEKDKKIAEYLSILKDRDPASKQLMEMAYKYMSDTGAILAEIHTFISTQKRVETILA